MEKKYILYPGEIKSKTDGQIHFIDALTLARLYKVPFDECTVIDIRHPDRSFFGRNFGDKYIRLYPRNDGRYSLSKQEHKKRRM